jgi:aldose 1-epimerase
MSAYKVQQGSFSGQGTVELIDEASQIQATILPSCGSNLIAFTAKGRSFLKTPKDFQELKNRPSGFGTPVLMPPGRIKDGVFHFQGREYRFEKNERGGRNHIHGLVISRPWEVAALSAENSARAQLTFASDKFPELKSYLPFVLSLTFTLADGSLTIQAQCQNLAAEALPFWLGFHPYFRAPLSPASSKADCFITLATQKRWQLEELVPTGERLPVEGKHVLSEPRSLEGLLLDDVYTVAQSAGRSVARYEDRAAKAGIEVEADSAFGHWVVYTGKDLSADFVCLEPYTGVPNAPNLPLPPSETGVVALERERPFTGEIRLRPF